MKKRVTIVDYGLGNILSAQQSFLKVAEDNKLNVSVVITNRPEVISNSTHIVLPGQGAFETCINNLINIKGMVKNQDEKFTDIYYASRKIKATK